MIYQQQRDIRLPLHSAGLIIRIIGAVSTEFRSAGSRVHGREMHPCGTHAVTYEPAPLVQQHNLNFIDTEAAIPRTHPEMVNGHGDPNNCTHIFVLN